MKRANWILLVLLAILLFNFGCEKDFGINSKKDKDSYLISPITRPYGFETSCGSGCAKQYGSTNAYVKLNWSCDFCVGRTGFKVYKDVYPWGDGYNLIATLGPNTFEYCDENIGSSSEWTYYYVTVLYGSNESVRTAITNDGNPSVSYTEINVSGINSYYNGNDLVFTWDSLPGTWDYYIEVFKNGILYYPSMQVVSPFGLVDAGTDTWGISASGLSPGLEPTCWSGIYTAPLSTIDCDW